LVYKRGGTSLHTEESGNGPRRSTPQKTRKRGKAAITEVSCIVEGLLYHFLIGQGGACEKRLEKLVRSACERGAIKVQRSLSVEEGLPRKRARVKKRRGRKGSAVSGDWIQLSGPPFARGPLFLNGSSSKNSRAKRKRREGGGGGGGILWAAA